MYGFKFGFGYGSLTPYRPYIQYSWSTHVVNDVTYLRNTGTGGSTYNAEVNACNHIYLDGVSQYVDYDTTSSSYQYMYKVSSKEFEDVTSDAGHITVSHSQYFTSSSALTTAELNQLNANPDLINRVWFDNYVLVDGFAKADMVRFYKGDEGVAGGQYLVDYGTLGEELVVNGTFDSDTSGWTAYNAVISYSSGAVLVDDSANDGAYSSAYQQLTGLDTSKQYVVSWYQFDDSGEGSYVHVFTDLSTGQATTIYGTGYFSFTFTPSASSMYLKLTANGTGNIKFDNVSVKRADTAEIINYTSIDRTNLLNTNYGASTLFLTQDSSGRATGYDATELSFTGDERYVDTGWIPDGEFIWELGFDSDLEASGALVAHGKNEPNGRLYIGRSENENIIVGVGSIYDNTTLTGYNGYLLSSIKVNTSTGAYTVYINGEPKFNGTTTFTGKTYPLYIGNMNDEGTPYNSCNKPVNHFKVITNATQIANYDAVEAYNKWYAKNF